MALTYMLRNGTLPGMPATNPDPRTSDDMFVIEMLDAENEMSVEELEAAASKTSPFEMSTKQYEA
jgi:hypothetical protein